LYNAREALTLGNNTYGTSVQAQPNFWTYKSDRKRPGAAGRRSTKK
jgi:hypothetical protein